MNILLGVTGGVAAYKAAELVRALQQRGVDVRVAMTASAEQFVRPLTFAALTGHPVLGSLWQPETQGSAADFAIEHIAIAQEIDALVIAPATANTLARLANGLADDLISTVYLATKAHVIVAPAMNVNMWNHPATQANLAILQQRGVQIVAPESGYLACGMTGGGRLAELETIAEAVVATLARTRDLTGETVLVTAGGTREPVDAVRFIGNRSSGKMGHAIAEEAASRGARVILVTASPLSATGCEIVRVNTASEMLDAVLGHLPEATIVMKAAAVADFRPVHSNTGKLRRGDGLTLELKPTEDILAEVVARRRAGTLVIGFAAEVDDAVANGRAKLLRKRVDALFVNDISRPGLGFDADDNAGWWLTPETTISLSALPKRELARRLLDLAMDRLRTSRKERLDCVASTVEIE